MSYRNELFHGSVTTTDKWDGKEYHDATIHGSVLEIRTDSRRRKPQGPFVDPTPYFLQYLLNKGHVGSYETASSWKQGTFSRLANSQCMNALPLPLGAEDECVTEALTKLKDQSINFGVALAEVQQTANLVGTTASKLARSVNCLKRRDFTGAFQALGVVASKGRAQALSRYRKVPDQWLELQYGWKPLLSDVHGASETLARKDEGFFRATVTARRSNADSGTEYVNQPECGVAAYRYSRTTGCFVRFDFKPGNDFAAAMSRAGVTNPFEISWEKVPFSFVVDWFLPIGDFVSNFDATVGWHFGSGSKSVLSRQVITSKAAPETNGSYTGSYRAIVLERTVYGSVPFAMPVLKSPISVGHMANGLSLLAGAFGRK